MKIEDLEIILAKKYISIRSVTGEEHELSKEIQKDLTSYGIKSEVDEWGNVIGIIGSGTSPILVFNGHIDTVPPVPGWTKDPFNPTIEGDKLYGLGSSDMKGSLASIVASIIELSNYKLNGTIIFTGVVGEEGGSETWGSLLIASKGFLSNKNIDYIVVGEGSVRANKIMVRIGQRGYVRFRVVLKGVSTHSSVPTEGANALYRLADFLNEIRNLDYHLKPRYISSITFNPYIKGTIAPTIVKGGQKLNIIPAECEIYLDRRLVYGETIDEAYNQIKNIINHLDETHANSYQVPKETIQSQIEILHGRPPYLTDLNDPRGQKLVKNAEQAILETTGSLPEKVYGTGYTDAEILNYYTKAPAIIIGAGEMGHTPDEYVKLSLLKQLKKIYIKLALKLLD
ncbi:MAG: M20 family metallopeptidase [Thermoprotei archaeon]|jgi:acetylornithine deacetylase/succinyl-diaminopimelate desuccinylase family protein